ncbi:CynX/NimT family MFS transporter [Streptococcus panodentis]|uniref:MFS transporter n=1 Tax=Streptococcus panodentis TaxID=1581472 RepID=A0ABS5AUX7_9STRE|nr:MFS transporter [Streptococcus panodentis]MBP2620295.1 MFS transporter [Streptococcus panodentis]
MKKKHSAFLLPGIMMLGIALRTPFTVLPIVLTDIAKGLQVPVNSLGLLTSLPLIMFALCSAFAPRLAQKVGLERLFSLVLLALTLGSLIRIVSLPLLYAGTIILGAAIAILNVLLPSVIQANQPHRIGFLTTLYITSMGLSITLASAVAVPIVKASSWRGLILVLTLVCLLVLLVWLPNSRHNHRLTSKSHDSQLGALLRNPKVWALIVFGGLQSLLFYTAMTWLPTLALQAGLSKDATGMLASVFSLISLPFSMTIPSLTARLSAQKRRVMISLVAASGLTGIAMLLINTDSFVYWLILNLLIGISVSALFPYLMVTFSLKTSTPEQTAQLSGLAQTGGYILAALGPSLFGFSFDVFQSWTPAIIVLFVLTIIMTLTLFYIEKFEKIL